MKTPNAARMRFSNVSSPRGAPMGRLEEIPPGHLRYVVSVCRMKMIDGDYDRGGAYWGAGDHQIGFMYQATTNHGGRIYVRAKRLRDATAMCIAKIKEQEPDAEVVAV